MWKVRTVNNWLRNFESDRALPFLSLLVGLCVVGQSPAALAQNQCLALPMPPECVSFEFQADVSSVVDPGLVLGALMPGDMIDGMITINTAVTDIDSGPDDGFYPDAIECARINLADRSLVFALDPTLPIDERRMEIVNDMPASSGGFTLFSDAVAAGTGGFATMDIAANPPAQDIMGAAALSYAYSKSCIQTLQFPCPPTLLADDSIPDAPGDVTSLDTFPLNFRFADLFGTGTLALVETHLTRLDPSDPIPCPEPAFALAWPGVAVWLGVAARIKRRSIGG